jgi:hypothetical protein
MNTLIKDTKYPLLLIFNILNNNNIKDEQKYITTKIFLQNHIMIAVEYNLLDIININNILTHSLISDTYYIISKQLNILPHIILFKKAYNYKSYINFWNLDIDEMIVYLNKLQNRFLSLFDGSKGIFFFHLRLKGMKEENDYHLDEIHNRLKKTYDMFKLNFFNQYKIILLNYYQFIDLSFENKIKYTEYIFNKINNILSHIINYLRLYNNYRLQLYNLLYNESNINININDVDSDIDNDDIILINNN